MNFNPANPTGLSTWVRVAWRDSRGSRAPLLLAMAALALGVAVLVAMRAFSTQLNTAMDRQSRVLLGADYSVRSLHPFDADTERFLRTLPGESVRETQFFSMAHFPAQQGTRLSSIRALSGPYPFYGDLRTLPPDAANRLSAGGGALVEETLLYQMGAAVGDPLQIGQHTFTIIGQLTGVTGETPATATFLGARIYIATADLPQTELLREGSLARYYVHYQLPPEQRAEDVRRVFRRELADRRLTLETAAQRREVLGNTLAQFVRYLELTALAALWLGVLGGASAMQLYARKKRLSVAILRCLGATGRAACGVYILQATTAAVLAAMTGTVLGGGLQHLLPRLLAPFLPVPISPAWQWDWMVMGLVTGSIVGVLFALYPLLPLRHVPALEALRMPLGPTAPPRRDLAVWGVVGCAVLVATGVSVWHTQRGWHGLVLTVGLLVVLLVLTGLARGIMIVSKFLLCDRLPLAFRQGLAHLHRPQNQTLMLTTTLGFGAFLLITLGLTQTNLTAQFQRVGDEGEPNMILFNVQRDQRDAVETIMAQQGLRPLESNPIVTMRLREVNGRTVGQLRDDPARDIPHWVLFREYRSTYRSRLVDRDVPVQGEWVLHRATDPVVPVSIEQSMADYLDIGLGARLTFDVQGMPVATVVRSIRNVNWRQMRTNFFVIFPPGVLEAAPQQFAIVTRTPDPPSAARLQNAVMAHYPNVSAVDLRLVLASLNEVLDQAALALRVMALFSVVTGLLVLGASVAAHRLDREEEAQLLRVLGATRGQRRRIALTEYALMGGIASLSGALLALFAGWLLARLLFQLPFRVDIAHVAIIITSILAATLCMGAGLRAHA